MKFLLDMGISPRCAEWLRAQRFDAVHLYEQNLHKLSDYEVFLKARSEKRILLTLDLDFARILASAGMNGLPIAVIFRLSDQRPFNIQAKIAAILPILERHYEPGNTVLSVGDSKVRIRILPI